MPLRSLFRRLTATMIRDGQLARWVWRSIAQEKLLFAAFIALSLTLAFSEGVSIALLVPILQAQQGGSSYDGIPVLGWVARFFAAYDTNDRIALSALLLAGIMALRGLNQYLVVLVGTLLPLVTRRRLVQANFDRLLSVRLDFIAARDMGELYNQLRDLPERAAQVVMATCTIFWNSILLGVYLFLLFSISWQMGLASFAFVGVMSLLVRRLTQGALHASGQGVNDTTQVMGAICHEALLGMKLIRLQSAEDQARARFEGGLAQYLVALNRRARMEGVVPPAFSTLIGLFVCGLLAVSAYGHPSGESGWVGEVLLFLFVLSRIMGPVGSINAQRAAITSNIPAIDAIETFADDARRSRQPSGSQPFAGLSQGIVFDQVVFAYPGREDPVLRGISLTVAKGRMVALVGPSGAGKSTITALLTRLYDPTGGRILVDGTDLCQLEVASWRRRVSVVSQDMVLFNDTILANVAFGIPDAAPERIREACRMAEADEFIQALPDGYDTVVGERGLRLSGGQQQRLSIARAILRDPDILILDEATSHLDTVTERKVQKAVETLAAGRTIIVIAHRLSTIRQADTIVVMDGGKVVECGSHAALLAAGGQYSLMLRQDRIGLIDDDGTEPSPHG